MRKYKNIKEYAEKKGVSVEDMKFFIMRSCLDLGCNLVRLEEDELQDVENVFNTLYYFNDLLDSVE